MALERLEELTCCWIGIAGEELEVAHTETEGLVLCCVPEAAAERTLELAETDIEEELAVAARVGWCRHMLEMAGQGAFRNSSLRYST